MHYLLLDLATFTIRAYSLVVGAVLLTVPLNLDRSYVDADLLFVVFIFDTTSVLMCCQVLRGVDWAYRAVDLRKSNPLTTSKAIGTRITGRPPVLASEAE